VCSEETAGGFFLLAKDYSGMYVFQILRFMVEQNIVQMYVDIFSQTQHTLFSIVHYLAISFHLEYRSSVGASWRIKGSKNKLHLNVLFIP